MRAGQSVNTITIWALGLLCAWWASGGAGCLCLGADIQQLVVEFVPNRPAYVSEGVVRKIAGLKEGDEYTPRRVQDALKNLYGLKVFKRVEAYRIEEKDGVRLILRLTPLQPLLKIQWQGNAFFKKKELVKRADTPLGTYLTDEVIEGIRNRLKALYEDHGFFQATMAVELQDAVGGQYLQVHFDEGLRSLIIGADVELVEGVILPQVYQMTQPLAKTFFSRAGVAKLKQEIGQYYRKNDFPAANVEYFLAPGKTKGTVVVVFLLETGPHLNVRMEGAEVPEAELKKVLAIYRLADSSVFAEELSRQDLQKWLLERGLSVRQVDSTRSAKDEHDIEIVFQVISDAQVRKRKVEMTGNTILDQKDLLVGAGLNGLLDSLAIIDDRAAADKIRTYYQSRGFFDADCRITTMIENGTCFTKITVSEGALYRLHSVDAVPAGTANSDNVDKPDWQGLVGVVYTETVSKAVVARASDFYMTRGFRVEGVQLEENKSKGQVDVIAHCTLTGPIHLENVVVLGSLKTRPRILNRMVTLRADTPLNLGDVYRTESKLYASGIFENVALDVNPRYGDPDASDLVIRLREAPRFTLNYGLGYQEWEGVRGMLELTDTNFLGYGQSVGLLLRGSAKKALAQLSARDDTLFLGRYPLELSAYVEREDRVSFKSRSISLYGQTVVPWKSGINFVFRVGFEKIRNTDIGAGFSPSYLSRSELPITLTYFSATAIRDTRDNIIEPERGHLTTLDLSLAPKAFGADTGYLKTFFQEQYYRPLVKRKLLLAASFRFGTIQQLVGTGAIPISERFFAGGSGTLRGFKVDYAGPLDPDTNAPIGGNALIIGNAEVRFPIYKALQGGLFYDVGNVFIDLSAITWRDVTHSVGMGLRVRTPLGPVRFDFGYSLKEVPITRRYQYFITIGNAF